MAMLTLDRIRVAIRKSGYSARAVFDRLSCGRGTVMRIDFAILARMLEPGLTDDNLSLLWYQMGKVRGGTLSLVEFVKVFEDGVDCNFDITQLPGALTDILGLKEHTQAPFLPISAWSSTSPRQDLTQLDLATRALLSPRQDLLLSQPAGLTMPSTSLPISPVQSLLQTQIADQNLGVQPRTSLDNSNLGFAVAQQTPPPQVQTIAHDWVLHADPQTGREFWHSVAEGRSSWTDPRPDAILTNVVSETVANDWVEHNDPGTGRKFWFSAREGRSSWTDPRPTPSIERTCNDDRFRQLMDYFNQIVQSRGYTAAVWFDYVDIDKDGFLSCAEFIKGLADLGVQAVERDELELVFKRITGSSAGLALASVHSVVRATTDPTGFLAGGAAIATPSTYNISDARCVQLLEYVSQVLSSCGHTAAIYFDYIDLNKDGYLTSAEFVKGLTDLGVNGVDHSELHDLFRRVEGSTSDGAAVHVSSLIRAVTDPSGFLSGVMPNSAQAPVAVESKPAALDDARFIQLLDYIRQVLLSRSQTALGHLTAFDLDRDGSLSSEEFVRALRDLGLREGFVSSELRMVLQRVEGSGTDSAKAPVSALAAAISDPAGFLAGNVRATQEAAPQTSVPRQRRIIVQLRSSPFKKLGFGASRSSDGRGLRVDRIDTVGLLAEWNLQQVQPSDRVQVGDPIAEVNGVSSSPEEMGRALQVQGLLTIAVVRLENPSYATSNIQTGEQIIGDARFKQLLEYFGQLLLSRGYAAAAYFDAIDLGKHGCLSVAEFIKGLTDLGVNGIEEAELQKVFKRVEGSGLDSSQVLISSIVDAITDPTGFMARGGRTKVPEKQENLSSYKRITAQLRQSALKKLGFGATLSDDGLSLLVKRLDISGLLSDWNAQQMRSSDRVRVGDQIAEVNGQTGNPNALAKALQSPGLLTIVFTRLDQKAAEVKNKVDADKIIDSSRFKQLLEYFNQVLVSSGYNAAMFVDALDLNKDGYMSVAEFVKGWADLGVTSVDRAELQNVLQRIKGGGSENSQAPVNAIVDAITDPAGFIARGGVSPQSPAAQAGASGIRRMIVQLRPSGLKKLGLGASLSDDGSALLVKRIDISGLLADWNAGQKRSSERVRIGDRIAEVNGQSANSDVMAKALQSQGLLTIVFTRPDLQAADSTSKVDASKIIDDARFKQLLEYFNQVLLSRGLMASAYFNAIDLNKDGRLSSADFIKGLTDLGVNGLEIDELQKVFQRIDGSGLDSSEVLVTSIADALTDPAGFMTKESKPGPSPAVTAIRKKLTATLLPSAFKKLGMGASKSPDGLALLVARIDSIGVLADWNAEQKRSSDRVRVGDLIVEVNGQSTTLDAIAKELQAQGPLTIVFGRPEKTDEKKKADASKSIDDARFKELLEYFNQLLQRRGRTASKHFELADMDKDGRLSSAEFIKALADLGSQGVEISEMQKVLLRIKGIGMDSELVFVASIVAALTDPAGFIARSGKASEPAPMPAGLSSSGRTTIQLRPSFFKKLGLGMSPAQDRQSLTISRIDSNGVVADWNAEQKLAPDRVQVGDQIVEVNGKSGNADELSRDLQAQGLLTVVFVRRNPGVTTARSKIDGRQIIDDVRFKQLLVHFNALLMKRGQTASRYFSSLDINQDGRLSSAEVTKGLTDLGISGTDRTELQKVFRRIEGSGSATADVLISSLVDAFTNPSGFIAKQ